MKTSKIVGLLTKRLREGEDFMLGYQSNIAMAFVDEYAKCEKRYKSRVDILNIANKAAWNFLKTWMAK